jgi:hypothetical protein
MHGGHEGAWNVGTCEFCGGKAEEGRVGGGIWRSCESASNVGDVGDVVGEVVVADVCTVGVGGWALALGAEGVDVEMGALLALVRRRGGGWLLGLVLLLEVLEVLEDMLMDNCLVLGGGWVGGGACWWWEELVGHALSELLGDGLDNGLEIGFGWRLELALEALFGEE